jgi:hypothetical protein
MKRMGTPIANRESNEVRNSKKVRKSKPDRHSISGKILRRKMSEVISLRERVAQAELEVGFAQAPFRMRGPLRLPRGE